MPAHNTYTIELAAEICRRLSEGETLVSICKNDGMPARRTVTDWRKAHEDFARAYDEAMLEGCHAILEGTIDIADDLEEDPASRKTRIWARHELIKRKRPDEFSDKQKLEHSGSVGYSLTIHEKPRPK